MLGAERGKRRRGGRRDSQRKENKRKEEKRTEVTDRKSPPFAKDAKDEAPSSSSVGWHWKRNPRPTRKPGVWGTRRTDLKVGHYKSKGKPERGTAGGE